MSAKATRCATGADRSARTGLWEVASSVAGLILASRALGFLRWIVQASTVGAGTIAGAYSTANQVPNILYEVVVGGALSATVVPLLAGAIGRGQREQVQRTLSGLLGLVLAVLIPLALFVVLCADPLASLFPLSRGADPVYQHALVADFLRMFAAQIPLYGVGVVLTGVLQAHDRFTGPAVTPLLSSLVVMATYGAYAWLNVHAGGEIHPQALRVLGWGTTAGVAALSLPLVWPVRRLGLTLRPRLTMQRADMRHMLRLGGAGLWTLLAQQTSVVAILALARSGGTAGTIVVYQYSQAVYILPHAVLVVPVATVLYPRLAAALGAVPAGEAQPDGVEATRQAQGRELVARSTALVLAIACAGMGALLAVSHGAEVFFTLLTHVDGMGAAVAVMAPALVGYTLMYHLTRVLYAADAALSAAIPTCLGWGVVIAASTVAVQVLAPQGGAGAQTLLALAVGQTMGMSVTGAGMLVSLVRVCGAGVLGPAIRAVMCGAVIAGGGGYAARVLVCDLADRVSTPLLLFSSVVLAAVVAAGSVAVTCVCDRHLVSVLRHPRRAEA